MLCLYNRLDLGVCEGRSNCFLGQLFHSLYTWQDPVDHWTFAFAREKVEP